MTDDANARERLLRALEQVLGMELAGELMASLPPHDWSRLATKDDVEASRLATQRDFVQLTEATQRDIADLREATQRDIADLREATQRDIADLRETSRQELSNAVLRLEARMSEQSASFERALRTELSRQSRAAVAGMVGMVMTIGLFVLGLLTVVGV